MLRVREIRLELVLATLALCASAAASIATVVQTRVVGNQLSASVWPYLTFDVTSEPGKITLAIDNDGLGPALIRDARMTVDGTPFTSWRPAIKALAKNVDFRRKNGRPQTGLPSLSESDIHVGSVIRPGATLNMIEVRNPALDSTVGLALQKQIDIKVCYCSILSQCWIAELSNENAVPTEVSACSPKGGALVY